MSPLFLNKGVIVLHLHSSGIFVALKILLNKLVSHLNSDSPENFQKSNGISLGPIALPLRIMRIASITSSTLKRRQYPKSRHSPEYSSSPYITPLSPSSFKSLWKYDCHLFLIRLSYTKTLSSSPLMHFT